MAVPGQNGFSLYCMLLVDCCQIFLQVVLFVQYYTCLDVWCSSVKWDIEKFS